jgi:uncharacterized protein YqgC (DUF456 family)
MAPWLQTTILILIQLAMLVGLFGLLIPIFPGITVIWAAALVYGLVFEFGTWGIGIFVVITLLMIAGLLADNVLMGAGARKGGASWLTIAVALLAGLVGTLLFPPFGGLIAIPVAIFLLEFIRSRNLHQTWLAMRGLIAGWGLAFLTRFGIGLIMIVMWWLWVWIT